MEHKKGNIRWRNKELNQPNHKKKNKKNKEQRGTRFLRENPSQELGRGKNHRQSKGHPLLDKLLHDFMS